MLLKCVAFALRIDRILCNIHSLSRLIFFRITGPHVVFIHNGEQQGEARVNFLNGPPLQGKSKNALASCIP